MTVQKQEFQKNKKIGRITAYLIHLCLFKLNFFFHFSYFLQLSVLEAFYNSSSVARERYSRKGRQLILEEDILTSNELAWLVSQLKLVELSDGLHVQSQRYETTYKPSQKDSSGFFYCSLLSPFRAMEWIYVDSLRPMKRQN